MSQKYIHKTIWHDLSKIIDACPIADSNKLKLNSNTYMKNKLLSLASLLAVFSAKAVEIGPTGSGVEMSGFIDIAFTDQTVVVSLLQ